MVKLDPHPPPWSVEEVLGTARLPGSLVAALSAWLQVRKEDGGPLSPEKRSGQGMHSFLSHLASRVEPVPGFERLALFLVNLDGTVHLLQSLFFVPVGLYSTDQGLFV